MKKYLAVFLLFCLLLIAPNVNATITHWVDDNGAAAWGSCVGASPLSGASACSLSTANSNARPYTEGDEVLINMRAGTYSTGIAPSNSGSGHGTRIIYQNYNDELVSINNVSTAIDLNGRNYITITGTSNQNIVITNADYYVKATSADYNILAYLDISTQRSTSVWVKVLIGANSAYNWVHHCTVSESGVTDPDYDGHVIQVGEVGDPGDSYGNLIEDCTFFYGGHNVIDVLSKYNIIRNNYIHNKDWYRPVESKERWGGSQGWNLWEGNRFAFSEISTSGWYSPIFQLYSHDNILRKNFFYKGKGPAVEIITGSYCTEAQHCSDDNYVFNNSFLDIGLSGRAMAVHIAAWGGSNYNIDGTVVKNNIFEDIYGSNDVVSSGAGTVTNTTITGNYGDSTGDPKYTDETIPADARNDTLPDFNLTADSPCIENAAALTTTNGTGSSSTTLIVDDAHYFFSGDGSPWNIPSYTGITGDYIFVTGWANPIEIASINYSTNTITLASAASWGDGVNVYLAVDADNEWYGDGPDRGAIEYGSPGNGTDTEAPVPNPATFSSNPTADSVNQVSMTATEAQDATTPIYYGFLYDPASDGCNAAGCGVDGGTGGDSSGYQEADNTYTDSGLQTNQCYCYRTRSKDSVGTPNEGDPSSTVAVYTLADTPEPLTLTDSAVDTTTQILLQAITADNNPDANPTTTYAVYVASSSPNDSTWQGKYVDTDGTPSATAVWQSKAAWANTEIVGLNSNTTFGFQSIAKNGDGILTANSTTAEWATTYPPVSGEDETLVNITFENITINNTP